MQWSRRGDLHHLDGAGALQRRERGRGAIEVVGTGVARLMGHRVMKLLFLVKSAGEESAIDRVQHSQCSSRWLILSDEARPQQVLSRGRIMRDHPGEESIPLAYRDLPYRLEFQFGGFSQDFSHSPQAGSGSHACEGLFALGGAGATDFLTIPLHECYSYCALLLRNLLR